MSRKPPKRSNVIPLPLRKKAEEAKVESYTEVGEILRKDETGKILDTILEKAIQHTNADGGSIYFVDKTGQDSFGGSRPNYRRVLRFYRSLNRRLNTDNLKGLWFEINGDSIVGYVAMSGKAVRISDVYLLPEDSPFKFFSDADDKSGYKTKSVLAVPIKTKNGDVVGVVQLVNKLKVRINSDEIHDPTPLKAKDIVPFTDQDTNLMDAQAAQAAIALENAKLTQDIANLFESFVRASVTAIEARDPSTSGHSDRVAVMTVEFAKAVDRAGSGPFKDVKYSAQHIQEIRYASLLHDFGKIGVKENVLLKAKKLYPHELETVLLRLDTLKAKIERCETHDFQFPFAPTRREFREELKGVAFHRQLKQVGPDYFGHS